LFPSSYSSSLQHKTVLKSNCSLLFVILYHHPLFKPL
jgi:hypothetical protein